MNTDDDGLAGELLLATTGIRGFLSREHPRVLVSHHAEAARIPKAIAAELRAFVAGEEPSRPPGRPAKTREFPYLDVIKQLAQPLQPHDIEAMVGSHQDGSDALEAYVPLTRALAYLNGAAPRRYKQTLVTAEPVRPSDQEVSKFARVFAAVDAPMGIMDRLRGGTLLSDEVQAVATVYPVLYDTMKQAAGAAVMDALERNKSFQLGYRRERVMRTLLGSGPQDPGLLKDLQGAFGPPQEPGSPSGSPSASKQKDTYKTAGQRAESSK